MEERKKYSNTKDFEAFIYCDITTQRNTAVLIFPNTFSTTLTMKRGHHSQSEFATREEAGVLRFIEAAPFCFILARECFIFAEQMLRFPPAFSLLFGLFML